MKSEMNIPKNVIELLQMMVQTPTVNTVRSGDPLAEQPLIDKLDHWATSWQLTTQRLPVTGRSDQLLITVPCEIETTSTQGKTKGNVGCVGGDVGGGWILFDSHVDTVTVDGMTIDPFAAQITDESSPRTPPTLHGRGACDTKGTGAAMLWALRQYAQQTERANNVALLFSIDEESGMLGIRSFTTNDMGQLPGGIIAAIVGEPTLLRPIIAHNGDARFHVTTRGVAAHSSDPSRGRSAISMMMRVIDALESDYIPKLQASHPMTGKAQASVNMIRGGVLVNIIPDCCEIDLDRRLVPGENLAEVVDGLKTFLANCGTDNDVEVSFQVGPLPPESSASFLPVVQSALQSCGLDGEPLGVPFATHGADLSAADVPTLVLGPGDIAMAHTKNECIALDQLERGVTAYHAIMNGDFSA